MIETIKDGGPAFPLDNWDTIKWPAGTPADFGVGMTLRDWFAGQALAAVIRQCNPLGQGGGETIRDMFARRSYEAADAMLAAREATK